MPDPRITKLADLLTNYCIAVQPGERIAIRASLPAMPLVRETYRAVLKAGGQPHYVLRDDSFKRIYLEEANDEQLQYVDPFNAQAISEFDGLIGISGSDNTRNMSGIDPSRQQVVAKASQAVATTMMRRAAEGELRWVGTLFPTAAHAQEADMSLADFEDFVYGACRLDADDPVAEWQKVKARHAALCDWLSDKDKVRVTGPNADLTLSVKGRSRW